MIVLVSCVCVRYSKYHYLSLVMNIQYNNIMHVVRVVP